MLTPTIDEARWSEVLARGLAYGAHDSFERGVCAMEAASYIAREPWSDHPQCVDPVIAAFMRNWNDSLSDAERGEIVLPLVPLTIGTRGSDAMSERRSLMAADWLVRTHTVALLRLAKLDAQADLLAALPEITSMAQISSISGPLKAVRKDAAVAWAAAGAAAGAAAWEAAVDAARAALKSTGTGLQASAVDLVKRMCSLTEAA